MTASTTARPQLHDPLRVNPDTHPLPKEAKMNLRHMLPDRDDASSTILGDEIKDIDFGIDFSTGDDVDRPVDDDTLATTYRPVVQVPTA